MSHLSRAPSTFSPVVGEMPEMPNRHDKYYIPSGDVVFLVDGILFRVHRYFFVRESVVFRDMLSLPTPQGNELEGSSDAHPIKLPQVTAVEFSRFLWVFYNPRYHNYDAPWEEWASILRLAHIWQFDEAKALAVSKLDALNIPPVDKAVLAREFDVGHDWLVQAYAALGTRTEPLTVEEAERLGLTVAVLTAAVRECIRERRGRGRPPASQELAWGVARSRCPSIASTRSSLTPEPFAAAEVPFTPEDIADVKAVFGL